MRQSQSDLAKLVSEHGGQSKDDKTASEPPAKPTAQSSEATKGRESKAKPSKDTATQASLEPPPSAHQGQRTTPSTEGRREMLEINAPLLQLQGSDANVPMDLSRQGQQSEMLR